LESKELSTFALLKDFTLNSKIFFIFDLNQAE